jgi:hypothetical protein
MCRPRYILVRIANRWGAVTLGTRARACIAVSLSYLTASTAATQKGYGPGAANTIELWSP